MRLFAGIALPDQEQSALAAWVSGLRILSRGLRWSPPEQWHITLHFLGETREARYPCIVEALRGVRASSVAIQFSEPGFFERAGIFHVAVQPSDTLLKLHRKTGNALSACGFEPEARAYAPHITLARRKGRTPSSDFTQLQQSIRSKPGIKPLSFLAREYLLYQSFTTAEGARYEVREHFPLM